MYASIVLVKEIIKKMKLIIFFIFFVKLGKNRFFYEK